MYHMIREIVKENSHALFNLCVRYHFSTVDEQQ